jgi:hypothetical protein
MAVTATVTVENGGSARVGQRQVRLRQHHRVGHLRHRRVRVDLPSSNFDMSSIRYLRASGSGRLLEWDPSPTSCCSSRRGRPRVRRWRLRRSRTAPTSAADTDGYTFFAVGQ